MSYQLPTPTVEAVSYTHLDVYKRQVQIIVTVGGAIKMIPSTGVTLPLISYGGSSILSTLIVFAIIQGLAIVGTTTAKKPVRRKVPMAVSYTHLDYP